jgi:uncharacterized protein YkwD
MNFVHLRVSVTPWQIRKIPLNVVFIMLYVVIIRDFGAIAQTEDIKNDILLEINKVRAEGCKCGEEKMPPVAALTWDDTLETAAIRHVKDMVENDNFSHTGTDGSTLSDRVEAAGYQWWTIGENISWGYSAVSYVVQGWINSKGHCRNLMNPDFSEMGAAKIATYWVLDLGKPKTTF